MSVKLKNLTDAELARQMADTKFAKRITDAEIKSRRENLPKYKNDMTPEQLALAGALYAEQLKRYKKKIKEYNKAAIAATGLEHGDKVTRLQVGLFGMGCAEYFGKVIYDKRGRLAIRTTQCDGSGRKTFPLNKGWKKEYTEN